MRIIHRYLQAIRYIAAGSFLLLAIPLLYVAAVVFLLVVYPYEK